MGTPIPSRTMATITARRTLKAMAVQSISMPSARRLRHAESVLLEYANDLGGVEKREEPARLRLVTRSRQRDGGLLDRIVQRARQRYRSACRRHSRCPR